jgi:hypothetical protein
MIAGGDEIACAQAALMRGGFQRAIAPLVA